jgi:serine/threonine-protein kinase RsbW
MKQKFQRNLNSLERITHFIQAFVRQYRLTEDIKFAVELVVEELFTNMIKYYPESNAEIAIDLTKSKDKLILTLTDFNAHPFDITHVPEYDTAAPLNKRPIGKLGIHLIKKYMDDIHFEYQNKMTKLTLVKYLRDLHVRN